jgi:hypothetical protein
MPAKYEHLTIEQGRTFKQRFIWQDENGIPIDLSAASAKMQLRASVGSETVLLELSTDTGNIVLDAHGNIDLEADPNDTWPLDLKEAVYDLIVTTGSIVTALARGRVTIIHAITI